MGVIYINHMMGKMYSIEIDDTNTNVYELKKRIKEIDGTDMKYQTLVYNGMVMHENMRLSEYGVKDGDRIHFLVKYVSCNCGNHIH